MITDSARAVVGATVIATVIPDGKFYTAETDSTGRYEVMFERGSGNYIISFVAPGYLRRRERVVRQGPLSADSVFRLDVTLMSGGVQALAPVAISATRRARPALREYDGASTGNDEQEVSDPPSAARRGDLAAIAATALGINLVPSTDPRVPAFSVLGLSPSDNSVRLDGLNFSQAQIPTAARVAIQLETTAFDPAVGGFSGGALSLHVLPGTNYSSRTLYVSADVPALELTDAAGQNLGSKYRDLNVSGSAAGPFVRDKLLYSISAQMDQRSNQLVTISDANAIALAHAGVSPAAAATTLQTLEAEGISSGYAGVARTTNASVLGRFDVLPTPNRLLDVIVSGNVRREAPVAILPTAMPSQEILGTARTFGIQGEWAQYAKKYYLTRVRTGIFVSADNADPLLTYPTGAVRVTSTLPNGAPALANITFGGASTGPQSARSLSWQTTYETAWFVPGNRHRPKLTGGLQLDTHTNMDASNENGMFAFNSLADLSASNPALYTRVLTGADWHSREGSGWLSAGDLWQPTDQLSIQYGVRAEANEYSVRPRYNPLIDSLLNTRTDRIPNTVSFSPRLGFSWSYGHESRVSLFGPTPRGTISGGIGAFQGVLPVTLPGAALVGTGLPGSFRQISCVGPSAPRPEWRAYANNVAVIPSSCADGTSGTFADAEPRVTAISPQYAPTRSWRGSLEWRGNVENVALVKADAIYSLNLNRPSTMDVNLANAPQFVLTNEGDRPVFVASSQIDPSTGGTSLQSSRKFTNLSRVSVLTSDLRSESKQLSLTIEPTSGLLVSRWWSVGYAYTRVRDQSRGFDGSAFGDPRSISGWGSAGGDIRHSITASLSWLLGDEAGISLNAQLRSGVPYSPMVAGDVNGDGLANDRAFVFDPNHTSDSTVAQGMRSLLAAAPTEVRTCLMSQLGKPAGRNSCRGPWTALTAAEVHFSARSIGLGKDVLIRVTFTNVLGGLDALFNGPNHLRGWGQPAMPDPVLLAVRGFDPTTKSFLYQVNPTFGETRPPRTVLRTPFTVTLAASIPLGAPSYARQFAEAIVDQGRKFRGDRLTSHQIAARYSQSGFLEPVRIILNAKDSLVLSADQSRELSALRAHYVAASDSIWQPLGRYIASLPTEYPEKDVVNHVRRARSDAYALLAETAKAVRAILTPDQLGMLAPELLQLLDEHSIDRRRRVDLSAF